MFQSGKPLQPTYPSILMTEQFITSKYQTWYLYHCLSSTFWHHIYSYQHLETLDTKPINQNMMASNIFLITNYKVKANTNSKISRFQSSKINYSPWGPATDIRPYSSNTLPMILNGETLPAHTTKYLKMKMTNLLIINISNHTTIWGSRMKIQGR